MTQELFAGFTTPKAVASCLLDNRALRRVLISVASPYGSSADVHFRFSLQCPDNQTEANQTECCAMQIH